MFEGCRQPPHLTEHRLFLSLSTRGLVRWCVFVLSSKTISTSCAFVLVLYDPVFPLGVNIRVPLSSEAVKSVGAGSGTRAERGERDLASFLQFRESARVNLKPQA